MKKLLIGALMLLSGSAWATQVNPTSNVLADTASTAETIVLRDTNGVFDAASLQDGTVITAKLAESSVITAKLYLDLGASKVACITTNKVLGVCSGSIGATGGCNCN